jgi:steroid 5-alpha reductase family enzyme
MASVLSLFMINLLASMVLMTFAWGISVLLRNAGVADIFWGLGFVLIACLTFVMGSGYAPRAMLLAVLATTWGLRLAVHIWARNRGEPEDRRYRALREKEGERFWYSSLYKVFWMQGVLLWIISLVLQAGGASATPARWTWLDGLGVFLWAAGFVFETAADWQLTQFKKNPSNKGKVMNRGLWKYTRHPNYFGESLIWWGFFVIVLSTPTFWWTVISPATITFLLIRVSGVRLLESTIQKRRPEYEAYIRNTSAFFPWFPKNG